jgi:ribonuclease I
VRPLRPGNKVFIPLFVVAVALLATWNSQRHSPTTVDKPPPAPEQRVESSEVGGRAREGRAHESGWQRPDAGQRADFDFYLLVLSSHPAFCADGHAREPECRATRPIPLSIHGLWPERLQPGSYPRDCPGPPLELRAAVAASLQDLMPGMADGLHEHEWRKHGTCTGLEDDSYFTETMLRARAVSAALAGTLTTLAGGTTSAADLRAAADGKTPGLGATLTFHCRTLRDAPREQRREPFLIEVRQCLDNAGGDGGPGKVMACATVNRRDQGCGASFRIAGPRP